MVGVKKLKNRQLGLNQNKRVDWNLPENLAAGMLSQYGLHAHAIAKATGLSVSRIYYRNKKTGIRIRDYRNGQGPIARVIIENYSIDRISILPSFAKNKLKDTIGAK